jgi:UDP:flavonoid glycosyltransferase YjiC (YdhE family)
LTGSGSCDKRPSPETLREAIRTVLNKPNYRARVAHG